MSLHECDISCNGDTVFDRNTAQYFGGGMMFYTDTFPCTLCNVATFHHSVKFLNNSAVFGGGFLSLDSNVTFSGNATFSNNSAALSVDKSGIGGGFFGCRSTVSFLGHSALTGNAALDGGSMYGSYTAVFVNGSMDVSGNSAIANGGGLYFTSESECQLMESTLLVLSHNRAGQLVELYISQMIFPHYHLSSAGELDCFFQLTRWPVCC